MEFSLRNVCDEMIVALKGDDKANLIKLIVDITLPDWFMGHPGNLKDSIMAISNILSWNLVNGVITIEVGKVAQKSNTLDVYIEIVGRGQRGNTTTKPKDSNTMVNQLAELKERTFHNFQFSFSDDEIVVRFEDTLSPYLQTESDPMPFLKRKVLLAEDNDVNTMVFTNFMEEWGVEITTAVNGAEAVSLVQEFAFDAILMDIHMPVMSGVQATARIREFNEKIPIIALTASTLESDVDNIMNAGSNDYLLKPVSSTQLFQTLSKYLK